MIIERIERPNAQPIIQPSRSKLERQAANEPDPNLYGINARQGRGPCCAQCKRPIHDNDDAGVCIECGGMNSLVKSIDGSGIVRAVYWSLCVWAVIVTAILVIGRA